MGLGASRYSSTYLSTDAHLQLKKAYQVIATLKANSSGFTWSDTRGLDITIHKSCTWNEYIVVRTIDLYNPIFFTNLFLEKQEHDAI